ncbi:MAG TPA: SpoIIE family protein phosphatase [Prolixibacteraceae bacterium]|nr:SpoIIE family protein phosphatase [Prolixibacteraceae bacterium]HPT32175.1 SpoIIE family protein phosphatase [Prolixibacteraceae bacterium]
MNSVNDHQKMSDKSLAYRLGIYISLAVMGVFIIFMFLLVNFHIRNRKLSNEDKAKVLNSNIIRDIRDRLIQTEALARQVQLQSDFYLRHDGIPELLTDILDEYEFLECVEIRFSGSSGLWKDSLYVAIRENGKSVFTTEMDVVSTFPDEKTWQNYLPDPGVESWSEPFRTGPENKIVTLYNYPFQIRDSAQNSMLSATYRCVVSIGFFRNLINQTRIWDKGYAFLVSPAGTYMTYPLPEYELKRNMYDVFKDRKIVSDSSLINNFMAGKTGPIVVRPPVLGFKKAWTFSTPVHHNDWLLVFTVPFSELYRDIAPLLITMSIVMLVVVIAIFLLVFSIARKVMEPLSQISSELHSFSIEVLDQKFPIRNETLALQKSLQMLQERYERHKKFEAEVNTLGKKFVSDLQLASEIQHNIIPPTGSYSLPDSNIRIHTVFRPAEYVSGDLYDFFMIDERHLLITMGDVSGGGIPAALFMGVAQTYIRSNASLKTAKDIVNQVNIQLCKNNSNQFFLTLFLGILDIRTKTFHYCNAGHSPALVCSGKNHVRELTSRHGLPLGLYPEKAYGESVVSFEKGESLILYTDGITEHINDAGELFGVDSFIRLVEQIQDKTPEMLAEQIMESIDTYGKGVLQHDDLSLMVVNYG